MEKKTTNRKLHIIIGLSVCAAVAIAGGVILLDRMLPQVNAPQETIKELTSGQYIVTEQDDIEALLEQPEITVVVIPKDVHVALGSCLLQKEIVIEAGGTLEAGYLEIDENGRLDVNGTLDLQNGVLNNRGGEACMNISTTGQLLENDNSLILEYSAEDAIFENSVSVRTEEELEKAAEGSQPIRAEGDISITKEICIGAPFYINKEATIRVQDSGELAFEGTLLANYGNILGCFRLCDNARAINYGTMTMESALAERGSVLYNAGKLEVQGLVLDGGLGINAGQMYVGGDGQTFTLQDGAELYNHGTFTAQEASQIVNNGWIENTGDFLVEDDARLDNNVFYNRNYFESSFSATLDEKSGIYFGNGEFRMNGIANVAVWKTLDPKEAKQYRTVATEDELIAAMEDSEVTAICTETPIDIKTDLVITKPVFAFSGLSCEADKSIELKNTYLFLLDGAAMDSRQLWMDNALVVAQEGDLTLENAQIEMKNGAAVAIYEGDIVFSGSTIRMKEKSVLSLPLRRETTADDWTLEMEEARFISSFRTAFKGACVTAEDRSYLQLLGSQSALDECDIAVDRTCEYETWMQE